MHPRASLLCLLALLATPLSLRAQVVTTDWPTVRMDVLVTNRDGDLAAGLTADALLLKENGQPIKIDSLAESSAPMSVCLLIDTSGSMYERLPSLRVAARSLLDQLPPDDEVCVVTFAGQAFVEQPLTLNRQAAIRTLVNIRAAGGTALNDALLGLSTLMRKQARYPSRAIVLLSDASDNASTATANDLLIGLGKTGSPAVHVLTVPSPGHTDGDYAQTRSDQKSAMALAAAGGGFAYLPRNADDLRAAVDHLAQTLKSRYTLTFTSASPSKDGRERTLVLALDKAHQKAKDFVRGPEGYYAPTQ